MMKSEREPDKTALQFFFCFFFVFVVVVVVVVVAVYFFLLQRACSNCMDARADLELCRSYVFLDAVP